jgi:hypothetical protein
MSPSPDERDHRSAAVRALADREYRTAGDEYARAAWLGLAEPRPGESPFDPGEKGWVGTALGHFVVGTVAYRVAGLPDRATRRAVEGVAVARDLRPAFDHPVQRACLSEVVADFRAAGDLDGAADAYDEAATAYEDAASAVDDSHYWTTTPLFEGVATPIQQVARGGANGEIAVSWEDLHGSDPDQPGAFLASRVRYKRGQFGSLVAAAVESGHLAAPRGTTEYDNRNHVCPNCGSTDVNWVADSVLCLRCSSPSEKRDANGS